MFVEDIRTELEAFVARLDGDVLDPADAEHLLAELTVIERIAAAGKAVAADRVAESGRWRKDGDRNEADWLAKQTGETVGAARGTLATAKKLKRCPKTSKAFRTGKLSKRRPRPSPVPSRPTPAPRTGSSGWPSRPGSRSCATSATGCAPRRATPRRRTS